MPSRFGVIVEGALIGVILALWTVFYSVVNPPSMNPEGLRIYEQLGEMQR